ncbi:MAG: PspC domain-containing protein [Emcibacter sp.]|nr:PspC domain-containing protein [Emcibacter sp.]
MSNYRNIHSKKLYKNSRRGKISGVFSGLGDYLNINPLILRVAGIAAILITGPIVIVGYLLVSLLLDDNIHDL